MPAISVLHAPRDEALGEKIAAALSRGGHAARRLGDDPLSGDLLLEDGAAIVIWSAAATKLARLHVQAREALERGALIPVTVGGARAPSGFEALQPVDLSGWGGDENDPRWRFVLDEINLASRRSLLEDGPVWAEAEEREEALENAAAYDELAAAPDAPVTDQPPYDDYEDAAGEAYEESPPQDAPSMAPLAVEARYAVSVDRYWPEAPAPKKRFRFSLSQVALGGALGFAALSAAAIALAPALLKSSAEFAQTGAPSIAFVQPAAPVEEETSASDAVKPQSDFEVTAYRDPAEEGDAELQETADISGEETGASLPADAEPEAEENAAADAAPVDMETVAAPEDDAAPEPAVEEALAAAAPAEDVVADNDAMENLVAAVTLDTPPAETLPAAQSLPDEVTKRIYLGNYFKECVNCPDMAALPAGSFRLGSPEGERARAATEGPLTDITLAKPFAIGTREVTHKQWEACVADGGCRAYTPSDLGWGRGDRPVTNVSFEDAQGYVVWLSAKTGENYRLPSEAEWEFAARGGTSTAFSFGEGLTPDKANYNGEYAYRGPKGAYRKKTTPVASFAPNNFGLFDMHGNVWEWTQDCWNASHAAAPKDGSPVGAGVCGSHVIKGGAWNSGGWRLRAAHRIEKPTAAREYDVGFRVARDMD